MLAGFPCTTGTGVDCSNPRSWLLLGDDFLHRLIDLLMAWEKSMDLPTCMATVMVFLGKPGGGTRPIGLLHGMMRVWSRLRSQLSHHWEKDHADEAF